MYEEPRRTEIGLISIKPALVAVIIVIALAIAYSILLIFLAPEEVLSWINELLATFLSVAAFLVGVALYSFQVKSADRKRRKDLLSLVHSELAETITSFGQSANVVDRDDDEETEPPTRIALRYEQSLILEEAAKSGLFCSDITFNALRLAKMMHAYNTQVSQANAYLSSGTGQRFAIHIDRVREAESAVVQSCKTMPQIVELQES